MIPLYSQEQFNSAKSTDKLLCRCYYCHQSFNAMKKEITAALKNSKKHKCKFCSRRCGIMYYRNEKIEISCQNCDKKVLKQVCAIKYNKYCFCSQSCAAIYNNRHKVKGTRRSKLEVWLEKELKKLYPTLEIYFNQKSIIGSELDIYIPSLNLAFEINGIFHYKPIFGELKFLKIKENDKLKAEACIVHNISLYTINTSKQLCFTPVSSKKYIDFIKKTITKYLINTNNCPVGRI